MSLFRRGEIWYASFTLPNGKRFKQSLGTKDKRQATELHDKLKAEAWRVSKLGEIPDITFEEACVRWLEEKAHKKSLDDDKSRIGFWLQHFAGMQLRDITESKIYSAMQKKRETSSRIHAKTSVRCNEGNASFIYKGPAKSRRA